MELDYGFVGYVLVRDKLKELGLQLRRQLKGSFVVRVASLVYPQLRS